VLAKAAGQYGEALAKSAPLYLERPPPVSPRSWLMQVVNVFLWPATRFQVLAVVSAFASNRLAAAPPSRWKSSPSVIVYTPTRPLAVRTAPLDGGVAGSPRAWLW